MGLGVGGIPRGRIIEIFGPESSGKTTLALHIVAEAQKTGGVCAYVDAEHAMDPEYSKRLGVNINELLISQPDTGEQALEIVESLVRSGKIDIGVMFDNPETTPGGKALKFYTSVRLDIRRIAQIKKGDEVMGGRVRVKVVKNKVAAPFKQTEFDLMYNEGISRGGELIALGEKMGLVKKSGTSYEYDGVKLGRGYDATRQFLRENKKVSGEILRAIQKQLKEGGTLQASEGGAETTE